MWEPQFVLAELGWRIVAPYLRGFDGPSARTLDAPGMDDFAIDIADLLQTLGVPQAVIGGLSMGGYVALSLFRMAPGLFRAMILADTRADADSPATRLNRQRMIETATGSGGLAVADDLLPALLGRSTATEQPSLAGRVRELMSSTPPDTIVAALRAMMTRGDSTQTLPSVRVPALVVVGEEDTLTPPSLSRAMVGALPSAELVIVPRAGHLSNLEQPEAFNGAVARFLDRL